NKYCRTAQIYLTLCNLHAALIDMPYIGQEKIVHSFALLEREKNKYIVHTDFKIMRLNYYSVILGMINAKLLQTQLTAL
ncbi:hypothetical protein ACJX0J_009372, partial [Zea mays]